MSPQQITQTIATLTQAMTTTRPTVTTASCTDPKCPCGGKR